MQYVPGMCHLSSIVAGPSDSLSTRPQPSSSDAQPSAPPHRRTDWAPGLCAAHRQQKGHGVLHLRDLGLAGTRNPEKKKKKQEHTHHSPRGFDPGTGEHQPITCKTAQWELGISPPFGHLRSYDRRLHRSRDGQGWQSPEIATDLVPPRQIWPSSPWFGGDISLR